MLFHHAHSNWKGAWPLASLAGHQPNEPLAAQWASTGSHARYCLRVTSRSLLPSFVNAAVLAVILATIVFLETTRNMENKTCFSTTLCPNYLYLYDFCQNFNWLFSNLRTGSLCVYTYPTLLSFLRSIMEKTDHWISHWITYHTVKWIYELSRDNCSDADLNSAGLGWDLSFFIFSKCLVMVKLLVPRPNFEQ